MSHRHDLSRSFGDAATKYETGRPEYPREAVEWMLAPVRPAGVSAPEPQALRVADVGAGTGKLSRAVRDLGAEVVAVDPDERMIAALTASLPAVTTMAGSGERIPLPTASVDAVVFGQSWHWVDPVEASREAARVLRPGGVLGLIWNIRSGRAPWVAELTRIMGGSHAEELIAAGGPAVAAPFGAPESAEWSWERPVNREVFLDMVASRSHVITAPEEERRDLLEAAAAIFDENAHERVLAIPYRSFAFRAQRPEGEQAAGR